MSSSPYENTRLERIKENRERMQKLGLFELSSKLTSLPSSASTRGRKRRNPILASSNSTTLPPPGPARRSSRLQNVTPVSYSESVKAKTERTLKDKEIRLEAGSMPEVYTEEHEKLLGSTERSWTLFVDGCGSDGKRIYDPIKGKSCHQCSKWARRSFTPGTRRSSRAKGCDHASKTLNQSRNCGPSKADEAASASIYPTYKAVLRPFQLVSNLTLPQKFVMDHIKPRRDYPKQQVKKLPPARLLTEDGKWSVTLNVYFKYKSQVKLSAGWPSFVRENFMKEGDEILFELLNNDPVVMKVSVFKRDG